jgi:hypothetical protein
MKSISIWRFQFWARRTHDDSCGLQIGIEYRKKPAFKEIVLGFHYNSDKHTPVPDDTDDKAIWRLREICAEPYLKKHGRSMTLERGWIWEMVHFIHHAITDKPPTNP